MSKSIQKHLKIRENSQGWTDSQVVPSPVLLNSAGGDCVDDLKIMETAEQLELPFPAIQLNKGLPRKKFPELPLDWWAKKQTVGFGFILTVLSFLK